MSQKLKEQYIIGTACKEDLKEWVQVISVTQEFSYKIIESIQPRWMMVSLYNMTK